MPTRRTERARSLRPAGDESWPSPCHRRCSISASTRISSSSSVRSTCSCCRRASPRRSWARTTWSSSTDSGWSGRPASTRPTDGHSQRRASLVRRTYAPRSPTTSRRPSGPTPTIPTAWVARASPPVPPQPTLYLHGERDGCIVSRLVVDVLDHLSPGSRMKIIERAGHFLHVERPPEVNAEILAFVA